MTSLRLTKDDLKSALPDTSSSLRLKGLEDPVSIHRDSYGIPHVRARTAHDAFFGQGFATAQDRLWHMDFDRHRAYGRWSEFAGPAGLELDKQMRRFQIGRSVKDDLEAVNAESRAMLETYAAGVNAFIESTSSLPVEYALVDARPEPWRPWDCLAVFKVRHILMGVFEGKLWRARLVNSLGADRAAALLGGYQPGHLVIVPPGDTYSGSQLDGLAHLEAGASLAAGLGDADAGSNSWALSGSRTASGRPLLAGDPHRPLDTPNVYYQNHIACPEFDAVGLSFPGFPGFPHFGHNAHVAWCVTHAGADYQDLYVEHFMEGDPTLYELKGEWKTADVRREVIVVRGGPPVELDVTVTHHGPIIEGDPAKGLGVAFRYTATDGPNVASECIPRMLRASSADDLDESMRAWVDPCNNFLFADVHGDIGYLNRGKVPIRSMANAWLPVPGWTGEHEWQRFIRFEELARVRNPSEGYIVTANNRIVGDDYPHYIALDFAPEHRARRILDRLTPLKKATVEDMAAVHAESVSIPGRVYLRLLKRVEPADNYSRLALRRLAGWDGSMDAEAVAPTIYSAFRIRLHERVLGHLLGVLAGEALSASGRGAPGHVRQLTALMVTMADEGDTSLLPPESDWESVAARALADGMADLRATLGGDIGTWRWGRLHRTRPSHPLSGSFPNVADLLDPPAVRVGGDGDTPRAAGYSPAEPYVVTGTSVARYVFDLDDWDGSRWVVPLGASGHPGSTHYADQTETWRRVELVPMLFDWERIAADAESHQTLEPV